MKLHVITQFDSHYAAAGLVMLQSLLQTNPESAVTVLCLDDRIGKVIHASLGHRIATLERQTLFALEPKLAAVFKERLPGESYATLKSVLVNFFLKTIPEHECLWFVDADTYFYQSLEPVQEEMKNASVGLSPHRFNETNADGIVYGQYNAGFVAWRNDETGKRCTRDWQEDCLAWCHQTIESDGRFMNQGYLNHWPSRYPGVRIISHPGANLAAWNLESQPLSQKGNDIFADQKPLIFYHFSNFWRDPHRRCPVASGSVSDFQVFVFRSIYQPYLAALSWRSLQLRLRFGMTGIGSVKTGDTPDQSLITMLKNLIRPLAFALGLRASFLF
jgi:hypothetical protein